MALDRFDTEGATLAPIKGVEPLAKVAAQAFELRKQYSTDRPVYEQESTFVNDCRLMRLDFDLPVVFQERLYNRGYLSLSLSRWSVPTSL